MKKHQEFTPILNLATFLRRPERGGETGDRGVIVDGLRNVVRKFVDAEGLREEQLCDNRADWSLSLAPGETS